MPYAVPSLLAGEDSFNWFAIIGLGVGVIGYFVASGYVFSEDNFRCDTGERIGWRTGLFGVFLAMVGHMFMPYMTELSAVVGFELPAILPIILLIAGLLLVLGSLIALVFFIVKDWGGGIFLGYGASMSIPLFFYILMRWLAFGWDDARPILFALLGMLLGATLIVVFITGFITKLRRLFRHKKKP